MTRSLRERQEQAARVQRRLAEALEIAKEFGIVVTAAQAGFPLAASDLQVRLTTGRPQ